VLSRYGGPEHTALSDVPQPSPRANELLVHVHAAGLNPVDFKTRAGKLKIIRNSPLPIVRGNELSGVVEDVWAGVQRFAEVRFDTHFVHSFNHPQDDSMGGSTEIKLQIPMFTRKGGLHIWPQARV